jgi:hypothetical protein
MEETIKNVISDLQYKVDVLKQEKQYLLDMCRNCETCAQRFCCQYCKNKTAKVIAIRIKTLIPQHYYKIFFLST